MSLFSTILIEITYCNNCIMVCDYNESTADVFLHTIYYFHVAMYVCWQHDLYLIQNLINYKHCPLKYKCFVGWCITSNKTFQYLLLNTTHGEMAPKLNTNLRATSMLTGCTSYTSNYQTSPFLKLITDFLIIFNLDT